MKYIIGLILIFFTLFYYLAHAKECTIQDYTKEKPAPNFNCPSPMEEELIPNSDSPIKLSVPLLQGKVAPWDGILLDPAKVIKLGLTITALRRLRWLDTIDSQIRTKVNLRLIEDNYKTNLKLVIIQRDDNQLKLQQSQKNLVESQKWYKYWAFGVIVGMGVTSTVTTIVIITR
jgi:hypothetical protein